MRNHQVPGRVVFLFICGLAAVACASHLEDTASNSEALQSLYTATYSNQLVENSPDVLGTTSTVMINGNDPQCGSELGTLAAWEQATAPTSDHAKAIFIGKGCGVNPVTVVNNGTQVTTAATGTPPEWTAVFPNQAMIWIKEPHLLPLKHDAGWVALVGLVGVSNPISDPTPKAIAVVLSTDGGTSWVPNSVHLVDDQRSGLQPDVVDLDATSASVNDYDIGNIPLGFYPGTNRRDLYVTWASHGQRWLKVVGYNDTNQAYRFNPPLQLPATLPTDVFFPNSAGDTCGSQGCELLDMSVSSGLTTANRPFVFVEWPSQQPTYTSQPQCDPTYGSSTIANQVWHAAYTFDGTAWTKLPDSPHTGAAAWSRCAGTLPGFPRYRNLRRSSLAFEPTTHSVIDAVAIDSPTPPDGTFIEVSAYIMDFGTPPPASPRIVYSSNPLRRDTILRHDQWMPVVATDAWSGVAINWVDSVDDPGTGMAPNRPFGIYGATTYQMDLTQPWYNWDPAHQWNQARVFPVGNGPGALFGDPTLVRFDDIGRHNSIGSLPGIYSSTFGGDNKSHTIHSTIFLP